jgi:hypothetical protein
MRLSATLSLGTFLFALTACAPIQAPATHPVSPAHTPTAPSWIDQEEIPDGLAAVGIGQANAMADKSMQRTMALADARTKLAGKMKVRVQNLFSQLNQQMATASSGNGRNPPRTEVMNRVIENVTRQVLDQDLAGTNVRSTWMDPTDGSLYLFLVMNKESMDHAMGGAAKSQIKKEIALGEQSLSAALDKLDTALAASESTVR